MSTQAFPLAPGTTLLQEGTGLPSLGPSAPVPVGSMVSAPQQSSGYFDLLGGLLREGQKIGQSVKGAYESNPLVKIYKFLSDGTRLVTAILGLLLIAAAIFSHPAVRETIVKVGKTAGEAAAVAA